MASHPTVGVEEEFLLVDPDTGEPVARNEAVARHAKQRGVELQLEEVPIVQKQVLRTLARVQRERGVRVAQRLCRSVCGPS